LRASAAQSAGFSPGSSALGADADGQSLGCGGVKGADATILVGSTDVNSGASGIVNFSATIAEKGKSGYLTATATTSTGQTSELAPCVPEDVIFRHGVD
jgi:hypothetical protein